MINYSNTTIKLNKDYANIMFSNINRGNQIFLEKKMLLDLKQKAFTIRYAHLIVPKQCGTSWKMSK